MSSLFLAAMVEFLAPDLAYAVQDRAAEIISGRANRPIRIALGSTTGSSYFVGTVLNRHLAGDAGYQLDLVSSAGEGAISALLDAENPLDLAIIDSSSDAATEAGGLVGLAALETHSELIEDILRGGGYRLVPIADHEALATFVPGTRAGFIPPGLYGPERRIPAVPVPTITTTQILLARSDVPGRVVRDILEALYDPSFAREVHYSLDEQSGRELTGLPLHPAAEIYYHRNDPVTSDRLGRLSFLGTVIAALFAGWQLLLRFRRHERIRGQRQLLAAKLATLQSLRHRIEDAAGNDAARALIREADELLCGAELDNAADRLDAEGIQSLRSVHRICWLAMEQRHARPVERAPAVHPEPAAPHEPAAGAASVDPPL